MCSKSFSTGTLGCITLPISFFPADQYHNLCCALLPVSSISPLVLAVRQLCFFPTTPLPQFPFLHARVASCLNLEPGPIPFLSLPSTQAYRPIHHQAKITAGKQERSKTGGYSACRGFMRDNSSPETQAASRPKSQVRRQTQGEEDVRSAGKIHWTYAVVRGK